MKIRILFLLLVVFLAGCVKYEFRRGKDPYDKGFVVYRDGFGIAEYTLGKKNSVPDDMALAKERFARRHKMVEDYYKKMGYINSRQKQFFINYPKLLLQLVASPFCLPFAAYSHYKYEHDPVYRERIDKKEQQQDSFEEARLKELKDKLASYLTEDLSNEKDQLQQQEAPKAEEAAQKAAEPVKEEVVVKTGPVTEKVSLPAQEAVKEVKAPVKIEPVKRQVVTSGQLTAVITARPQKGTAPLTVKFSAAGSRSSSGRITGYEWDFGDGDTSTKRDALNTYYSGTYGEKDFTAVLKVYDDKGNTATASVKITAINK
ncbi:MAG: PKD domain-containing protein [Candidatus Omnitrophica bacterium]|jgi:hypothetical protein|nr:PKD domain-containing protein [Candidatus Omnitrophota bacterium]